MKPCTRASTGPLISSDNLNKKSIRTWLCFCRCVHYDFQTLQSKFSYWSSWCLFQAKATKKINIMEQQSHLIRIICFAFDSNQMHLIPIKCKCKCKCGWIKCKCKMHAPQGNQMQVQMPHLHWQMHLSTSLMWRQIEGSGGCGGRWRMR